MPGNLGVIALIVKGNTLRPKDARSSRCLDGDRASARHGSGSNMYKTATSPLTNRRNARRLSCEVELTIRFFKSQCSSMARPFYLATALRAEVRVSRSRTHGWINRHSGALDSGKEGEAP